jgi:hypothetical protein
MLRQASVIGCKNGLRRVGLPSCGAPNGAEGLPIERWFATRPSSSDFLFCNMRRKYFFVAARCCRGWVGAWVWAWAVVATVVPSLKRGLDTHPTMDTSRGCLSPSSGMGLKPLREEVEGSPDRRTAPRLLYPAQHKADDPSGVMSHAGGSAQANPSQPSNLHAPRPLTQPLMRTYGLRTARRASLAGLAKLFAPLCDRPVTAVERVHDLRLCVRLTHH